MIFAIQQQRHYLQHTYMSDMKLNPDAVRLRASSIPGCYEWNVVGDSPFTTTTTTFKSDVANTDAATTNNTTTICSFLVQCPDDTVRGTTVTTTTVSPSLSSNFLNMSNPFMNHSPTTTTGSSGNNNNNTTMSSSDQQTRNRDGNVTAAAAAAAVISDLARITIYCRTGTIMTSRILNGCVRNLFRKNVTSLNLVERCLRDPPELPTIDWTLIGHMNSTTTDAKNRSNETVVMNEIILSIPNNLELIDVGIAILTGERDKLVQHAKTLEHSTKIEATRTTTAAVATPSTPTTDMSKVTAAAATVASSTTTTGMEFQFSLSAGPMKHVDQCLHDIHEMGKLVKWVATNGVGTVFLYGNGGVAYTPNIPYPLYQRLSQLRSSKLHSCRPKYVTLGTKDRYFVTFHDNTFHYSKGLKVLDRELKKLSIPPVSVAFGTTYDAFCIIYDDGTYKYHGRGMPTDFIERLTTTSNTVNPSLLPVQRLSSVTLGPSGEWFVRFQDGQVDYGNISNEMNHAIQELRNDGHQVNFLDFGENGSYFISYD